MQKINFYLILFLSILLISCSDSEEPESDLPSDFENGVFILNEGAYNGTNASVSYYDLKTARVFNDVYFKSTGNNLGGVLNSAYQDEDALSLVMNGTGAITRVETKKGMVVSGTFSGLQQPRYMTGSSSKLYVTEWISFGEKGKLSVLNAETGVSEKTIALDYQPEGLAISGDYLFVANQGADNLFVVSLTSEEVVDTISVGASPTMIVTDAEGDLWIACSGGYDESFSPLNNGALYEVDPASFEVKSQIDLGMNTSGKAAINPAKTTLYYFAGTSVYAVETNATTAPSSAFIQESDALGFYGIGVGSDGIIYLADAKDYVQSGEVFRYETDGTFMDKFSVGIIPNGFVFN